ncbi:MAG: FAD-binding protein [Gammaproteobacteria bacterium]|nr:FAD-binding protein [Gammaproteobacteria bacterium]MDD9875573.1 FAD-binding protein [Gammaproteobacteria bacterium]
MSDETKVLVIAEHDNAALYPGTLNTVTAGVAIGAPVDVLVAGHGIGEIAAACAAVAGVARVLVADHEIYAHPSTEEVAALVVANGGDYTHILAPASTFGKALIPYAAALRDLQSISDISEVVSADTFVRPIYAGNALATVRCADPVKMITVRTTAFDAAAAQGGGASVENIPAAAATGQVQFVEQALSASERPELTSARVVVSGGRGLQSGDNFTMLEQLADRLGGAVGASRAAVDAGFVPNDYQVGQTGKVVAPDLYLAVGISGAIQHLAGMKDSKCIVAINNDEEAPIFQVADYSWNEDLFAAVPALLAELEK